MSGTRAGVWWRLGAPAILAATGLLFTVSAQQSGGLDLRPGRADDVTDLVQAQQRRAADLEAEVAALSADIGELQAEQLNPAATQALASLAVKEAQAGLTAVRGPGLVVTLDDAALPGGTPAPGTSPDDYVVHQQDVEGVVNALWAGGAEAMTIMDRRIVATSAVRCVGNVLILDGEVFSPPFVISGIGDADRMQQALDQSPAVATFRGWATVIGLGYSATASDALEMPAFAGSVTASTAEPAEQSTP